MSYRLKSEESIPKGLQRVIQGELKKTIDHLSKGQGPDGEEAIHSARQGIKKLRAVLRLVRRAIGIDRFRRENCALSKIGRALSDLRDARVLVDTLDKLTELYDQSPGDLKGIRQKLQRRYAVLTKSPGNGRPVWDGLAGLAAVQTKLGNLPLAALTSGDLSLGFVRIYKKGRSSFYRAMDSHRPEDWHACRKRVKDLWYQCRLLRTLGPKGMGALASQAKKLSGYLGEHHDLILLHEELEKRFSHTDKAVLRLAALTKRRRIDLEACAADLGGKVYTRKPREIEK